MEDLAWRYFDERKNGPISGRPNPCTTLLTA